MSDQLGQVGESETQRYARELEALLREAEKDISKMVPEEDLSACEAERDALKAALERIASPDSKWDDVDPDDGLHTTSVRAFARRTLEGSSDE